MSDIFKIKVFYYHNHSEYSLNIHLNMMLEISLTIGTIFDMAAFFITNYYLN